MGQEFGGASAQFGGDFGKPDGGLDRFDLAEEGADALERMVAPMLEQAGRFRGDEPLFRVG